MAWLSARLSTRHWRNLKYWLRCGIFLPGLWLLWNLQSPVLKPGGFSLDKIMFEISYVYFPASLRPQTQGLPHSAACAEKLPRAALRAPEDITVKYAGVALTSFKRSLFHYLPCIRHSWYIKQRYRALLKIRVAGTLGVSTSLTCSFPARFTPWGGNGKAVREAGPELLQFTYWITKVKQTKHGFTFNNLGSKIPSIQTVLHKEFTHASWINGNPGLYFLSM